MTILILLTFEFLAWFLLFSCIFCLMNCEDIARDVTSGKFAKMQDARFLHFVIYPAAKWSIGVTIPPIGIFLLLRFFYKNLF